MTKKEIIKDMKILRDKLYEYNNQVRPHSNEDYWSGKLYQFMCENIPVETYRKNKEIFLKPNKLLKRDHNALADMIDDMYGAGAGIRR